MTSVHRGFTLVELTVVVGIVGVLSALSIPIYQGYVVNSQLNRAVKELGDYRGAVEIGLNGNSGLTNQEIGYSPSNLTNGSMGIDIASFAADGVGHLEVTLGGKIHPRVTGVIVRYSRNLDGQWSCTVDISGNPAGWKNSYLPNNCSL